MEPIFFSNALVLTIFLGSGGICKTILHFDVSRGLRSQKNPILSHFTREFGQKLRAIALGGPTTRKSKISSQIIYKCTKPLIPSVKFRGHQTFFSWFFCNKKVAFLTSCWRSISRFSKKNFVIPNISRIFKIKIFNMPRMYNLSTGVSNQLC